MIGRMAGDTSVISSRIRSRGRGFLTSQTAASTTVVGRMEFSTERLFLQMRRDIIGLVSGRMDRS